MTIYKVTKYNRMEEAYEHVFYAKKENAEKEVETIKKEWNEGKPYTTYDKAWIDEIKTED